MLLSCTLSSLGGQKEIEPVKDESAQRFKDLQEEYTLYEAARKDPKQASEQVLLFLVKRPSHQCSSVFQCNLTMFRTRVAKPLLRLRDTAVLLLICPMCGVSSKVFQPDDHLYQCNSSSIIRYEHHGREAFFLIHPFCLSCGVISSCRPA